MANWTYLMDATYSGTSSTSKMNVTIQYDKDSITTTSVKLRALGRCNYYSWSYHTSDTFFITDAAGSFSRIAYLGGTDTDPDKAAYVSNSFTYTKAKTATYFSIPSIYICNDGQHHSTSAYTDTNWRGHYAYFTSGRTNYKSVINSSAKTISTTKYVTPGGTPSTVSISQTAGDNTITFSGTLGSYGNCNNMSSATLYYEMNGATKYNSHTLTVGDGTSWSWTQEATKDDRVWAYVNCTYNDGDTHNCSATWADCYYYGTGTTPGAPTISQTAGSNTITISGSRGNSPSHNKVKSSTLYYKFAGASTYSSITLDTSSTTYSKTITIDKTNNNKKLSAKVTTEYTYGGKKTGSETTTTNALLYYSPVNTGSVAFTDNGNNTFSVTGTRGTDGSHNKAKAATLYWTTTKNSAGKWTYTAKDNTQAFGTTGSGSSLVVNSTSTKSNIPIPTNGTSDTVTVAAAVVTTGTYTVNSVASTDTGWKTTSINLYKAPSAPSNIKLSYSKSRLTVKENWTLEWTGGTKTNNSSPIKGYRIRLYKNGQTMPLKNASGEIKTSDSGSGTARYYYDRDKTDTTMVISTSTNTFAPGDKIKFYIHAYTKNGNNARIFSTGIWSPEYTVQNAGVMQVKVRTGGTDAKPVYGWKEGVVWVKVNKGTAAKPNIKWVEADIVKTKVKTGGTDANPTYSWVEST